MPQQEQHKPQDALLKGCERIVPDIDEDLCRFKAPSRGEEIIFDTKLLRNYWLEHTDHLEAAVSVAVNTDWFPVLLDGSPPLQREEAFLAIERGIERRIRPNEAETLGDTGTLNNNSQVYDSNIYNDLSAAAGVTGIITGCILAAFGSEAGFWISLSGGAVAAGLIPFIPRFISGSKS